MKKGNVNSNVRDIKLLEITKTKSKYKIRKINENDKKRYQFEFKYNKDETKNIYYQPQISMKWMNVWCNKSHSRVIYYFVGIQGVYVSQITIGTLSVS